MDNSRKVQNWTQHIKSKRWATWTSTTGVEHRCPWRASSSVQFFFLW